jgi:hypothetical protein
MDATNLETEFGKPDMSDAAMGKAWLTWYGKKDEHNNKTELNIYTHIKTPACGKKRCSKYVQPRLSFLQKIKCMCTAL